MNPHGQASGGPNGEIGASLRYLSQRYSMPYPELKAILTDVGTEESVPRRCTGTGPASPRGENKNSAGQPPKFDTLTEL